MRLRTTLLNLIIASFVFAAACSPQGGKQSNRPLAKFEPKDGEVILFVGQELEAIGGLYDFNDGYFDHFDTPGGITMYSNIQPGTESFGHTMKGLDGLWTTDDWGDSPSNLNAQLGHPNFQNVVVALGLSIAGHEDKIADGSYDDKLKIFGEYLLKTDRRPFFLRIGYEFDGHGWNNYDRENYIKAYRRIHDALDAMGVDNVAYVWQSTGWVSNLEQLEEWYPGDRYVDWCGFSFFSRWDEQKMIEFARKKGKPVFIAEASPVISDHTVKFDGDTKTTILSNPEQAEEAWQKWFIPFFKTINDNPDVVKAVSYINCNWKDHAMWKDNPTFRDVDARLHLSEVISERWKQETGKAKYRKANPDLYKYLRNRDKQ